MLKDLFRENLLQGIFLGPLGDPKNEKELDPDPLGDPRICCQSYVRSASSFTSRERNHPKKAFFCVDVGILDCKISICNVLDRLDQKINQKEASMTIFKTGNQVRSFTFFCMLNFSLSLSLSLSNTHILSLFSFSFFLSLSLHLSLSLWYYDIPQTDKYQKYTTNHRQN